ncbi:MAG: hypothetical protein ACREDO_01205, partial [Methyloceanibacter sp.]
LRTEKAFLKLDPEEQVQILHAMASHLPTVPIKNREEFDKALGKALKGTGLKVAAPVRKAILSVLSERDESADICMDKDGILTLIPNCEIMNSCR